MSAPILELASGDVELVEDQETAELALTGEVERECDSQVQRAASQQRRTPPDDGANFFAGEYADTSVDIQVPTSDFGGNDSHEAFELLPTPAAAHVVDNRYKIVGELGAGAMGIVYRAEDVMLQRPAALKVIEPSMAKAPNAVDQFLGEARALARLRHDNVVQIYAFGSHQQAYFFAMELIDGENLDAIIERKSKRGTTLALARALEILGKIAEGLSAAHARNLVHRDVKPSNIVIEHETGRPVLVDFGVARHLGASDPKSSLVAGTPLYMAPEQVKNEKALIGPRSDVYSFACTAFELLLGRSVFGGEEPHQAMLDHVMSAPPLVSSVRSDYAAFDPVFARALAKAPRYRYPSATAFAEDLVDAATRAGLLARGSAHPTAVSRGERVLVLADNDGLRRAIVREATTALQKTHEDFSVECVTKPADLVGAFHRSQPSIVVLDDDQASGTSIELARQIRSVTGGEDAQIIVLTRDMLAERSVWESVGARRVAKPLSARALASALDDVCKRLRRSGVPTREVLVDARDM